VSPRLTVTAALLVSASACGTAGSAESAGTSAPPAANRVGSTTAAPSDTSATDATQAWFPETELEAVRSTSWGTHRALIADGRVYASNGEDVPILVQVAALPLLSQGDPDVRCAVIGLGSGVEATALAALGCGVTEVFERRADELRPAAAHLGPLVDLSDVRIRESAPSSRYDVVVQSQASWLLNRPHRLFTVERLRAIGEALSERGVLAMHVPLYFLHQSTHRRILATLAQAFAHVSALSVRGEPTVSDLIVLASDRPIRLAPERVQAWAGPGAARWLDRADLDPDLRRRVVFTDRAEILAYAADAAPYRGDDRMSPDEVPLGPASEPGADADPEAMRRFEVAHDAYVSQFVPFHEQFVRPGSRWGRRCREAADECDLVPESSP